MAAVELTSPSRTTVIVLGASNVSRGLARLASVVRRRVRGPVDLFVVAGHGRSYGAASRVAMRRLPAILSCGLWRSLDREVGASAGRRRMLTLVTDVGNDLLYGFSPAQVADWVAESVRRLTARGCRVAITRLPLTSITGVGQARYRALRAAYVPGCRLDLASLVDAATDLDARLVSLSAEHSATVIDQPGEWYGLDAIHVRRRRLDDLWHAAGDAWGLAAAAGRSRTTWTDWMTMGWKAAEVRAIARRVRYTPQPVVERPDLRLWLY